MPASQNSYKRTHDSVPPDESLTLYVRKVCSFGEVRIRNRAEAEEHLLTEQCRVGRVTQRGQRGNLRAFAQQKLGEIRRAAPPPDENNRPSTGFHSAVTAVASNLDWLDPYETMEVEVFVGRNVNLGFRELDEDSHLFFRLSATRAKVYMNFPPEENGEMTIVRGTCVGAKLTDRLGIGSDHEPGVYASMVVMSEHDPWERKV